MIAIALAAAAATATPLRLPAEPPVLMDYLAADGARVWIPAGTLAIDVKSRKVISTWDSGCGKDGPRGLALDAGRGVLFIACSSAGVMAVDAKTGARRARLETGD